MSGPEIMSGPGYFLSASLAGLLERLDSVEVVDFIQEKKLNDGLLKKLSTKLLSAEALVNDAVTKILTNRAVGQWLSQLDEAIYDADDLVDEINAEALRCKMEEDHFGSGSKVLNPISTEFNNQVEKKIMEILDRLKSILDQKDALGLRVREGGFQIRPLGRSPRTSLLVGENEVYGRDADKESIMNLLLTNDGSGDNISVIPIVGMGGIGKTTLAQLVYNDERVRAHFEIRAWVCISEAFQVFSITKLIFESITSQTCDITDLNLLQVKLKQVLMGKKFLFVLDDVWKVNHSVWDAAMTSFGSGAHGSKIIVTTRIGTVASVIGTVPPYRLGLISDYDSWELFKRLAFGNVESGVKPELEIIGKKIVQKCKGHSLAIKFLGGLLRHCEPNPHEWNNILYSEIWDSAFNYIWILPSLWLSYCYLPSHVKGCFAYCSIFPQDYAVEDGKLILLWMAENLLLPQKNKTLQEVGANYLDDLILRSFFSLHKGLITMHDLVNDLTKFVAGRFCLSLDGYNSSDNYLNEIRYASIVSENNYDLMKYEALSEAKRLRTLFISSQLQFDNTILAKLLPILICLRVLSLYGCPITELPDSIGKLKFLRYLDVSRTEIEQLPHTVCTLYNLQTLLLSRCRKLTQLPTNIGRLVNLRHLDITYTHLKEMPLQMGELKDLETLKDFVLGHTIRSLKDLQHLRGSLRILRLDVVDVEDVLVSNLKDKQHLSELQFSWSFDSDDCRKHREVLNGLQPHRNIKILRIENYGGEGFPNWVGDHSFVNMEVIHLKGCKNCSLLPPLGHLPSLKELYIEGFHGVVTIDDEFYTNGSSATIPFRSLKILHFSKFSLWKKWSFIEGSFPCLESLYLGDCLKLNVSINLHLPSLQTLKIFNCPELESFAQMRLPSNLNSLYISKCKKLLSRRMEWNLQKFTFLRHLFIDSIYEAGLDSFPEDGLLPTTLVSLEIYNVPCLKGLNGKSFQHLALLDKLGIFGCPKLQHLPEGLPNSLSLLCIRGCPLLYQRWKREEGEDWPEISHIPSVKIER